MDNPKSNTREEGKGKREKYPSNTQDLIPKIQSKIKVGTRGSLLARTQTEWVVQQIRSFYPDLDVETCVIQTTGDLRQNIPFAQVGTKGMFVKEIEQALLSHEIDIGVHSLKDMPSDLPEGLELACTPIREDPRDALLSRDNLLLKDLPQSAKVGTSSVRRQAQLRHFRSDLQILELRGNLDTRIRKLDSGEYDAIILACAGLERLGWANRISERISVEISVPAVGQGALALEIRADDTLLKDLLMPLNHADTAISVLAERGFQETLESGCSIPAGAIAKIENGQVVITGMIASVDGSKILCETLSGSPQNAKEIGIECAQKLLENGGRKILD